MVTSELCTASVCLDKSIRRKESISNLLQPHKPMKTYMLAEHDQASHYMNWFEKVCQWEWH